MNSNSDINTGVAIMRKALEMPMRKIASNAGDDGAVIIENVRRRQQESGNLRLGYNVMTGEYVDTIEAGFPDPRQGDPRRGRERGFHRRHDPDDRGAGHGSAGTADADAGW